MTTQERAESALQRAIREGGHEESVREAVEAIAEHAIATAPQATIASGAQRVLIPPTTAEDEGP